MRKGFLVLVAILVLSLALSPCGWAASKTIKIGINAPITGDIPKVGEGSKYAAEMWLEDIKAADLDGNGRPDIVAAARQTKNLKIFFSDNESIIRLSQNRQTFSS